MQGNRHDMTLMVLLDDLIDEQNQLQKEHKASKIKEKKKALELDDAENTVAHVCEDGDCGDHNEED